MSPKAEVLLECELGPLKGRVYRYDRRETCILGRAVDCNPRLPDDAGHVHVSRHHCLLDINPPRIRIKDFGSLNGTYVNGLRIGRKPQGTPQEPEHKVRESLEVDLKNGDHLRVGGTGFKIAIRVAWVCEICGHSMEGLTPDQLKGVRCPRCARLDDTVRGELPFSPAPLHCANCHCPVDDLYAATTTAVGLCKLCRERPSRIVERVFASGFHPGFEPLGFEIMRPIGQGGMGAVYAARRIHDGALVALKVMLPRVAVEESDAKLFLREAEMTRALQHPNVVRLFDACFQDASFFLTLEYCDGGSVDNLMKSYRGKLPPRVAVDITLQLLDALEYAHEVDIHDFTLDSGENKAVRGIVHRDVKPSNILLFGNERQRVAKLADFGLAKAFDAAGLSGLTRTGLVAGSPFFASRQQVINFRYSKPNVDVWASAASLYNMLTGKYPRTFAFDVDPWYTILQTKPIPIRERLSSVPSPLASVIDRALIDDPDIPYENVAEFRADLKKSLKKAAT